ncbi:MAG: DUF2505 domain-containing protein [Actinomycetaceae bacterium]|nr:DUF2505 domain-containing protein [Actinomycetaceae bacterium]
MTRFSFTLDYPLLPEQVRIMLTDKRYLHLRAQAFHCEVHDLQVTSDSKATTTTLTVAPPDNLINPLLRAIIGKNFSFTLEESWRPFGNTPCQGVATITTSSLGINFTATQILEPFGEKTKRLVEGNIIVKGDITGSIQRRIFDNIDKVRRAEHHAGIMYQEKYGTPHSTTP